MKHTTLRKLAGIAAIVTLASCTMLPMGMTASAVAADTYSITINNTAAGHTYQAYQIFTGNYSDGVLTNIVWGSGVTDEGKTALGDAAAKAATLTSADAAKAFAKEVAPYLSTTYLEDNYDDSQYYIGVDTPGYYLVKDAEGTLGNAEADAYTAFILEVVGNASATPKSSYPTVVKKVQEDDVTTDDNYGAGYNDVADWDMATPVPFKIIATMPSTINDYEHYYLKFTDTMDDTFGTPTDITVTVGSTPLTADQYELTTNGNDITVEIVDVKGLGIEITADTTVTIEYKAVLNSDAVIGLDGQENAVKLEYSNNPNVTGDGTASPGDENTGETPEDTVIVFTYGIDVTKTDVADANKKLDGAEFLLWNTDKTLAAKVVDGAFEGWVAEAEATTLTTDANGVVQVKGLDKGVYYLQETKAPATYELPKGDDAYFKVDLSATTVFTQTWTSASGANAALTDYAGAANEDKLVDVTVSNTKGNTLPETGGIGTTLFYVVGGTMAVGAGVYLIAKKRMNNNEE